MENLTAADLRSFADCKTLLRFGSVNVGLAVGDIVGVTPSVHVALIGSN